MSASKDALKATANKLRKQIAECEATLSGLRLKLAKSEATLTGQPVPVSLLDELWTITPSKARNRSTKQLCRVEWKKLPSSQRPTPEVLLNAMRVWRRCEEWKKDSGEFIPALHRWIKNLAWESLPDVQELAPSRSRQAPKTIPKTTPEEAALPEEIAALLGSINIRRINS